MDDIKLFYVCGPRGRSEKKLQTLSSSKEVARRESANYGTVRYVFRNSDSWPTQIYYNGRLYENMFGKVVN